MIEWKRKEKNMKKITKILLVVMVIFLVSITSIVNANSVGDKELCINGKVYVDLNTDGAFTEDELNRNGIVIELTELVNTTTDKEGTTIEEYRTVETSVVNENGEYNFKINPKNKYKIILNRNERKNYIYNDIESC